MTSGGWGTCQSNGVCGMSFAAPDCSSGGGVVCTMDAKVCPDGSTVGRTGPNCEFAPCDGGPVACTEEAKICPDGSTVGRTGPNCEFAPCEGSVMCTMEVKLCPDGSSVGRTGPNCAFAPCGGSGGTGGSCVSDSQCADGQECVWAFFSRRCQTRPPRRCFSWPFSLEGDASASSAASLSFGSGFNLGCPSGQSCVNGNCQTCLALPCAYPLCPGGITVPTTQSNGCPGCPRCSTPGPIGGCIGDSCLPCCPPVARWNDPPCRDCGLRG